MVVGLRSEPYFLHHDFGSLLLLFLLALLLLIEELLVVDDAAYRRISLGCDLDEVEFEVFGNAACLFDGVDAGLDIVAHQTHLARTNPFVDHMLLLAVAVSVAGIRSLSRPRTIGSHRGAWSAELGFFLQSVVLVLV